MLAAKWTVAVRLWRWSVLNGLSILLASIIRAHKYPQINAIHVTFVRCANIYTNVLFFSLTPLLRHSLSIYCVVLWCWWSITISQTVHLLKINPNPNLALLWDVSPRTPEKRWRKPIFAEPSFAKWIVKRRSRFNSARRPWILLSACSSACTIYVGVVDHWAHTHSTGTERPFVMETARSILFLFHRLARGRA